MSENTKRKRFVFTLSACAAIYSAVWGYRLIGWQSDSASDITKLSALVFLFTLILSFVWWTLIRRKWRGPLSGALAGLLATICIIPLPSFFGALKGHYIETQDLAHSVQTALNYSISTFSLFEFLAIPLSMAVGVWAARSAGR